MSIHAPGRLLVYVAVFPLARSAGSVVSQVEIEQKTTEATEKKGLSASLCFLCFSC
jgi:hypothetical protein